MKWTAKKEGQILDLLVEALAPASKTRVRKMLTHGMIQVSGRPVRRGDVWVKVGETIEYWKKSGINAGVPAPFPVLYEDAALLVVDKPPGLLTYGEKGATGTSLYRQLREVLQSESFVKPELYVVHRLDREVSGIVLFAKKAQIQAQLKENWKQTRKKYYALVEGRPEKAEDRLQSWLQEGPDRRMRSTEENPAAKLAITHYRTLQRLPGHTLLEIELETGRKNQIRVHLSEMGCPVVGDRRYGADDTFIRRIRLHAFYLAFRHPLENRLIECTSAMPKGFLELVEADEKYK